MERVDDVAAACIAELGPLDPMKLEKLVYYVQAWTAASAGEALFDDEVQAWAQGPVVPSLYARHRRQRLVTTWPWGDAENLSDQAARMVAFVVAQYGGFSGPELSALTHAEAPWADARGDLADGVTSTAPISIESMGAFYRAQVLEPALAVRHAVGSAALEGLEVTPAFRAVLGEVTRGERSAEDVVAEVLGTVARG